MVKTELHPQWSQESEALRDLKLTCMDNLLSTTDAIAYFKDRLSRFLLVSAGWIAAVAPGCTVEEIIGKMDSDFFSKEFAAATFEDEQHIIRTGKSVVVKVKRETLYDRAGAWVSVTKMPLRDKSGQIIGTFGIANNVTAQVNAENALVHQALHDPVTGLANRAALMDRLSQALVALERRPGRLAVLFVDLDHFKDVNDTFGHDTGDQVLAEVGRRLSLLSRQADIVARLGGDEFVVLCESLGDNDDVRLIADRIMRGVRAPYVEDGRDLTVTCSVGIAVASDPLVEPDRLVRDADDVMYEAKKAGRNCYRVYDPA